MEDSFGHNKSEDVRRMTVERHNDSIHCGSVHEFIQKGFKCLVSATKSSNRLPFGKGRDFYESYPIFHSLMKNEADNVLVELSKLMKHGGYRSGILKKDDDEKIEIIIETNDSILGKVGQLLDQISGIFKYPEPNFVAHGPQEVSGSWNVNQKGNRFTAVQVLNEVFKKTKTIEKPQLQFGDVINNDRDSVFEPKIKYKYNMLKPLAITEEINEGGIIHFSHPYEFELEHLKVPEEQLIPAQPIPYKSLEATPFHFITTVHDVKLMIQDCKAYKEIAVDLEHHSYRSFQGFTCLLQISTRDTDYIVDTLVLRNHLGELNEIFTDPKILKVFHGAESDLLWLQRDLGVYVVNMFDTYEASKLLNYPRLSLSFLLQRFCNVGVEKHFQLADWRIRPLPDALIEYARGDTHYLLFIYDNLKNILIEKGNGKTNYLETVVTNSTTKCLKQIYVKPVWNEDGYLDLYHKSKKLFDNRQKYALKCLYDWRDNTARTYDESYGYVLPNHMLLQISESLPREAQGILACCNPVPPLLQKHLLHLHEIILKARDQPLVEPVFEERRFYRATGENNLTNDSHLRCPHDLNHEGEFRDDLPVLISRNHVPLERDECLVASHPAVNVFEKSLLQKNTVSIHISKTPMLTPYERYKLTKPFNEAKEGSEAEAQNIITSNKEKIQEMEVKVVKNLIKKEPVEEPAPIRSQCLKKRKGDDHNQERKTSKKIKTENHLLNNSNSADVSNKVQENMSDIQPFCYSSVDFNKFQTYVESSKKSRLTQRRHKIGRKRN